MKDIVVRVLDWDDNLDSIIEEGKGHIFLVREIAKGPMLYLGVTKDDRLCFVNKDTMILPDRKSLSLSYEFHGALGFSGIGRGLKWYTNNQHLTCLNLKEGKVYVRRALRKVGLI